VLAEPEINVHEVTDEEDQADGDRAASNDADEGEHGVDGFNFHSCYFLFWVVEVVTENSESGMEGPRHAARCRQMRFDFGPLEFHAAADFVVGQNPALHPVIHRADPLVEPPRNFFFADETLRQRERLARGNGWCFVLHNFLFGLRDGAVIGMKSTDEKFEGGFAQHIGDAVFQIRVGIGPAGFNPRDFDLLEADPLRELQLGHAFQHPRRLQSVVCCHIRFFVTAANHFAPS